MTTANVCTVTRIVAGRDGSFSESGSFRYEESDSPFVDRVPSVQFMHDGNDFILVCDSLNSYDDAIVFALESAEQVADIWPERDASWSVIDGVNQRVRDRGL